VVGAPKSNLIYWVCQDLEHDQRVAEARLLGGKVTQLWHTLWPAVVAAALARAPWQLAGLSPAARGLLDRVDEQTVDTSAFAWSSRTEKLGDVCRLLERRLLVKSEEIHTPAGRHGKKLVSWRAWWTAHGDGNLPDDDPARTRIEAVVGPGNRLLPWRTRAGGRTSRESS
jgi:hypothetical protein